MHISELSNRYIKEPSDVVKVGQIVQVHVLNSDASTKRIALSMKTPGARPAPVLNPDQGSKPAQGMAPRRDKPVPPPNPQLTMDDKLAALADRWKKR